ncbi:hypothetical protein ALP48_200034 [Pseudomonas syringae pv. solidagae]|uniref:Uncharacterized protein n=1 Tax=Pseudomonas syringae pv. solidagae TaxID=264458 RepID=A0A3M5LMP0_PSESX|nr:hypothetical protein ALP49_200081 [Pseudomonas syringae pv. solidagae]RMT49318.1 hypothetical protein ALP48_200034 [Pseudomonas syringae pv. solidagae]
MPIPVLAPAKLHGANVVGDVLATDAQTFVQNTGRRLQANS